MTKKKKPEPRVIHIVVTHKLQLSRTQGKLTTALIRALIPKLLKD